MKYQQLENLEAGWKWAYLVKKWKEGEAITRYIDSSEVEAAVEQLQSLEHEPTKVLTWIDNHMSPALRSNLNKLFEQNVNVTLTPNRYIHERNLSILIIGFGKS